jgi:hypothetical protein
MAASGLILAALPFVLGQGCPGNNLLPVTPTPTPSGQQSPTGNIPPTFQFVEPSVDLSLEIGQVVSITWNDADPDSNAAITLLADPDNVFGNGNERVILALALEDNPTNAFALNTGGMPPGTYRIIARVNDNVNPELIAVATGRLILIGQGVLPGNRSPVIAMTAPDFNVALSQGETAQLAYCGRDADDGTGQLIPDIIILLDTDENPTNDIVLSGPAAEAEAVLLEACNPGPYPRLVRGVFVLGCAKDNDCQALANATPFQLTVDVGQLPPRVSGEPYRPRVTMWDHTNPPVHSYSRGNISITSLGSGTIDLGQVGRKISGAKFVGFDAGGLSGSSSTGIGDLDNDGADDFVIVGRFERPFEVGNVGAAYVIMGSPGAKFGNEIPLNSIGTLYRGSKLTMPGTTGTQGITSVCRVADIDGDALPEILFGLPYVEEFPDRLIDDPCKCACPSDVDDPPGCYGDLFPNPFSCEASGIRLTDFDFREYFAIPCSNDLDPLPTSLVGGYTVLVSSRNAPNLTERFASVISLSAVGQDGTSFPFGARFRGAWYDLDDLTQTVYPSRIIPDNLFGQTVNTMPEMSNPSLNLSPRFGTTLLISAPMGFRSRGMVIYTPGQDFTTFTGFDAANNAQSLPYYEICPGSPCQCPGGICRSLVFPAYTAITGAAAGDHLGYAAAAGDFNLDGNRDILMGAPGATRGGLQQIGIVYVLFGRPDWPVGVAQFDLQTLNPPRMEIRGTNPFDQFGFMQTIVGDVNQDGLPDIGFASQFADGPGGTDSGYIGVVFGGRRLTGENIFTVNQVGTVQLPGFRIYGTQPNGHAGAVISNAGDFNGDGTDDLLVCAPDEIRLLDGQNRRGVAYVIFGGPHLNNGLFSLSQVGTSTLPGAILVSPYVVGSADEAPIDWVNAAGDVNGDGFDDLLVGVSRADFVNPLDPNQRRIDAGEAYLIYGNNTGSNRVGN